MVGWRAAARAAPKVDWTAEMLADTSVAWRVVLWAEMMVVALAV